MINYYFKRPSNTFNEELMELKKDITEGSSKLDHFSLLSFAILTKINFKEVGHHFQDIGEKVLNSLGAVSFRYEIDLIHQSLSSLMINNLNFSSKFIPMLSVANIKYVGQILNVLNGHNQNYYPGVMKEFNDFAFKFQ